MNSKRVKKLSCLSLLSASILLVSCAATQTVLEHHSLEADSKLSKSVFLDPVSQNQKTIFIAVKNTSQESLSIEQLLAQALTQRGYQVVHNPSQAHYMLQANILKIGKMSRAASQNALGGGFGSALASAGTGAALGAFGNSNTVLSGGVAGGIIGLAADSLVKDVNYTMITDVQISERVGKGVVHERFNASLENGAASGTVQSYRKHSDYQRFRTRVVSNADKVNLKFADARGALEMGLVKTLSGIF